MAKSYQGVALLAPATVAYRRYSEHGAAWWIGQALREMLRVTGLKKEQVDGLAVSSFSLAPDTAVNLAQHYEMTLRWVEQITLGGASAIVAARRAARAIQSGDADVVACIGGDSHRKGDFASLVSNFSRFSSDAMQPYGAGGPNAVFAMITRAYMEKFGATREDFGRVCIAQRANAAHNPLALLREPLTMEHYLQARPVAEPLHLFDCVMPCAGADGFLVTSVERARSLGVPYAIMLAAEERYGANRAEPVQLTLDAAAYASDLYDAAGIGPHDIDCVQTYDDYPVIALMQLETFGFCARGGGAEFTRRTQFTVDGGGLPMNTGGGQLSVGQAGLAGGFLGVGEALRQVTHHPLGLQVPKARIAAVSGFGMVNYDRGLCFASALLQEGEP